MSGPCPRGYAGCGFVEGVQVLHLFLARLHWAMVTLPSCSCSARRCPSRLDRFLHRRSPALSLAGRAVLVHRHQHAETCPEWPVAALNCWMNGRVHAVLARRADRGAGRGAAGAWSLTGRYLFLGHVCSDLSQASLQPAPAAGRSSPGHVRPHRFRRRLSEPGAAFEPSARLASPR